MGGSRGLMGPEAFAQLRAMVDKLLSKKVDDTAEGVSAALNRLTTGSDTPSDADYYICQYASGGTSKTTYHRRPVSALWSYIKGKADAVYAAKSHVHSAFDVQFSPRRASTGSVMPVHAAFMGAGRCLSAFLPPSGIKLEYSNDGGDTWLDYGTGDAHKRKLASMPNPRNGYRLGGPNASGALGDMLRVTYEPSDGRYGLVQSALVWVSTNGGSDLLCGVETSTMGRRGHGSSASRPSRWADGLGRTSSTCLGSHSEALRARRATRTDGASRSPRRRTFPGRPRRCSPSTSTAQACGTP